MPSAEGMSVPLTEWINITHGSVDEWNTVSIHVRDIGKRPELKYGEKA